MRRQCDERFFRVCMRGEYDESLSCMRRECDERFVVMRFFSRVIGVFRMRSVFVRRACDGRLFVHEKRECEERSVVHELLIVTGAFRMSDERRWETHSSIRGFMCLRAVSF
jgi:hypothetical protein